ncbi:MAG TPA: AI-2E family transporter [Anaerolineales bacterium]|nr:AI-2E family transporter [Anaerolineales bacterium]
MTESMKPESSTIKQWTTNQVVLATLFVVGVMLFFWLLYRFRTVAFLFFIAMVIGTAIRPAVEWFYKRGVKRSAGVILIYLILAAFLLGFLALVVPLIVDQATQIFSNLPDYLTALRRFLLGSNNLILWNIGIRLPSGFFLFGGGADPSAEELFDQVNQTFYYAGLFFRGLLSVLAVFLLAYYWTQEGNYLVRNLVRLIPRSYRNDVRDFINTVERRIGGFVRAQGILSLTVGSAAFTAYSLIGLPYALVLGMVAGLMELVPIFGPALGAIPAILVALSVDPGKVVWVLVATGLIQLAENVWLVPRVMKSSMGVNPILTLLSLITFSAVFGFMGALLAIPLAAIIQLTFERFYLSEKDSSQDRINIQKLQDRSETTADTIMEASRKEGSLFKNISQEVRLEIESIARELDDHLKKIRSEEEV